MWEWKFRLKINGFVEIWQEWFDERIHCCAIQNISHVKNSVQTGLAVFCVKFVCSSIEFEVTFETQHCLQNIGSQVHQSSVNATVVNFSFKRQNRWVVVYFKLSDRKQPILKLNLNYFLSYVCFNFLPQKEMRSTTKKASWWVQTKLRIEFFIKQQNWMNISKFLLNGQLKYQQSNIRRNIFWISHLSYVHQANVLSP